MADEIGGICPGAVKPDRTRQDRTKKDYHPAGIGGTESDHLIIYIEILQQCSGSPKTTGPMTASRSQAKCGIGPDRTSCSAMIVPEQSFRPPPVMTGRRIYRPEPFRQRRTAFRMTVGGRKHIAITRLQCSLYRCCHDLQLQFSSPQTGRPHRTRNTQPRTTTVGAEKPDARK